MSCAFLKIKACLDGLFPCVFERIAVDASRDQRKANRTAPVLSSKFQRTFIGIVQCLRLSILTTAPDRTNCVDDILCLQDKAACNNGRTCIAVLQYITSRL